MVSPEYIPVAIALLATFCAAGIVISLFYTHIARQSESYKRFSAIAAAEALPDRRSTPDDFRRRKAIEVTLQELEEKQKARKGAKPSLLTRMRQAGLSWSAKTYYLVCLAAGLGSFLLSIGLLRLNLLTAVCFGITGGLLLPHLYVNAKRGARLKAFSNEFPNALDVIVRGVKSGLPLVDCLRIISLEAQEPVRGEFKTLVEDQTLGLPMDEAVQRLPERIPVAEANFFAIVIALQSRTGGSLSEALANLSRVIRERKKMQAKIKAVSSEAKISAAIIGCLPVVVAALIYFTSPQYIALMFTTLLGNIVLAVSGLWMLTGTLVMRKMINFDF